MWLRACSRSVAETPVPLCHTERTGVQKNLTKQVTIDTTRVFLSLTGLKETQKSRADEDEESKHELRMRQEEITCWTAQKLLELRLESRSLFRGLEASPWYWNSPCYRPAAKPSGLLLLRWWLQGQSWRENQQSQLPPVLIRAGEGTDHKDLKRMIWNYPAVSDPQALPVACSVGGSTRKSTNLVNLVQGKYRGLSLAGSVEGVISLESWATFSF